MSAAIFYFVTVRRPQQNDSAAENAIDLGLFASTLLRELSDARPQGTRAGMQRIAQSFLASDDFIRSRSKLDPKLLAFLTALPRLPEANFRAKAAGAFQTAFDTTPAEFVKTSAFTIGYRQASDSIVAALIAGTATASTRALLVRLLRAYWLIRRLATDAPASRTDFLHVPLLLPEGIFPLPAAASDLKEQQRAAAEAAKEALAERNKRLAELAAKLAAQRQATAEVLTAFERTGTAAAAPESRLATGGFLLSDAAFAGLTDSTKGILKSVGISTAQVDVGKTVALLERESAATARQLYSGPRAAGTMVRIGSVLVEQGAIEGGLLVAGANDERSPGPCPPQIDTAPPDQTVTVPTSSGDARILGMADLLVVEQQLLRYQLGEVSHIENVLQSESRSRKLKITDSVTQTQTAETETTTEKEQDLASTERFELQTESQAVINENASQSAGLTIHASYGPSVDATASYNAASSTSSEQSMTAASNYAREVSSKAVSRVQSRTLTRRTVTTSHVAEEINEHGFDNKMGQGDIVGVYRFVDKIYLAQVVNYGKRLMLEFVVPEPAAFLRYALTHKPVDNVMLENPDRPGYCLANGTTFVPLQAGDLAADNYLYWTSKYGAQDVAPPPPSVVIAGGSLKAPDKLDVLSDSSQPDPERKVSSQLFDVTIPDGYLPHSAYVNIYGETQAGIHQIIYQLEQQQGTYIEPGDDQRLYFLNLRPTPTLTVSVNSIGFHNYEVVATVFCTVSTEKFQDWQLKTFAAIMTAYNDLKSSYNEAVKEANLQAADGTPGGTNPENNRITEQTELKKACLALLTGQRFDLFDAVARNVAPYGYPEIDFDEARAEGEYIRRFEQSFEWNNMVYIFYPYFWGKKEDWVTVAQIQDTDPIFAQFLRAGAARVQVPVRVGFQDSIATYLSAREPWNAEGAFVNRDAEDAEPTLSIIDELKSQLGDNNVDGPGLLNVTHGSAAISGSGTAFSDNDVNRRIIIGGATYVIKSVEDEGKITLTAAYTGSTDSGVGYALGGTLVGQPWEVKVPTDLVKLDHTLVFS